MHILVVPSFYPSHYRSGTGLFVRDQVGFISRQGYKVGVAYADLRSLRGFTPASIGRHRFQISRDFSRGVPLVRWNAWNLPGSECTATRIGMRRAFRAYEREFGRPDLVHAHCGLYAGVAALELKERYGIPFVLTEHSSGYARGLIPDRLEPVLRNVFDAASRVIVVSSALDRSISPYCKSAVVIPNLVDTEFFSPGGSDNSSVFEITSVGNLIEVKGFDVLLNALLHAARVRPKLHLNIVGQGALRQQLGRLAEELGVSKVVTFHGQLSRADLRDLLRSSNLYVSASRVETFGVATAEALACGLPVIASNSGGSQEIIANSDLGSLVPVEDSAALAHEIVRLFDSRPDLDLARAANARAAVVDRYGPKAIGDQLDHLYRGVGSTDL